jgi:hypothetical protein
MVAVAREELFIPIIIVSNVLKLIQACCSLLLSKPTAILVHGAGDGVIDGVLDIEIEGVGVGDVFELKLGVILGVIDGVAVRLGVLLGVIDGVIVILGVIDGVIDIDGVIVGVTVTEGVLVGEGVGNGKFSTPLHPTDISNTSTDDELTLNGTITEYPPSNCCLVTLEA